MKKHILIATVATSLILAGCDFVESEQKMITIDGGKYSAAAFRGQDEDGKAKEEYLIGLTEGAHVTVINAPITSKDTSSNIWELGIGYSDRPHIACKQHEEWAKQEIIKLKNKAYGATVSGTYRGTYSNIIELKNCKVESF